MVAAQMDSVPGMDLIVACDGSNEITVLYNDGDGVFSRQERYLSGGGTDGLAIADFDHDGDIDVAITNDEHISYPGTRDHYATVTIMSNRNTVLFAGDMDRDGDVDGNDLAIFAQQLANGTNNIPLSTFVTNFGRTGGGGN